MDISCAAKFIDRCDRAVSESQIRSIVEGFTESFGFEHYLLRATLRLQGGMNRDVRATNYPGDWLGHYGAEGYGLVDPAVAHSRNYAGTARLDDLLSCAARSKNLERFADEVRASGLDQGVTVPLRTAHLTGFLNLNCKTLKSWPDLQHAVNLFAIGLSDMLTRVLVGEKGRLEYEKLTLREREVIYWALTGKTAWETSVILGITERTIVAHLHNGMETLGCTNKAQLLGRVSIFVDSDPALNHVRLEL